MHEALMATAQPGTDACRTSTASVAMNSQAKAVANAESWSAKLQSPVNLARFSPSRGMADENFHGIGLQLATERCKAVGRFGRQAAASFDQWADIYERFEADVRLLALASNLPTPDPAMKLANETQLMAHFFRAEIVQPWKKMLAQNRTTLETQGRRYLASRAQCMETRARALEARRKYGRVVREAEIAFLQWRQSFQSNSAQNMTTNPHNDGPKSTPVRTSMSDSFPTEWEVSLRFYGKQIPYETEELIRKVHLIKTMETRYRDLVENENDSVDYAQKIEQAALDAIQGVEIGGIHFFFNSVLKPISQTTNKQILDRFRKDAPSQNENILGVSSLHSQNDSTKKNKDLFSNIFGRQANEEGTEKIDAEACGVPLAILQLREDVKREVKVMAGLIKTMEMRRDFTEEFSKAAVKLARGLGDLDFATPEKAIKVMGLEAWKIWTVIANWRGEECGVITEMATSIDKLRTHNLEPFLETIKSDLKNEADFDNRNWKTLCDVAKTEAKAAARYRQVRATQEKARERVFSADAVTKEGGSAEGVGMDVDPPGMQAAQSRKNRMSKALFAGGEAMKKFQENARLAVAKTVLIEADNNVEKEQQVLDEASATKTKAITDYKNVTEIRIQNLQKMQQEVKQGFKRFIDLVAGEIKGHERSVCKNLRGIFNEGNLTIDKLRDELDKWVAWAIQTIDEKRRIAVDEQINLKYDEDNGGYKLNVSDIESGLISKMMKLEGTALPPPEFLLQNDVIISNVPCESELDPRSADSSFDPSHQSIPSPEAVNMTHDSMTSQKAEGNVEDEELYKCHRSASLPVESEGRKGNGVTNHADSYPEVSSIPKVKRQESHEIRAFRLHFGEGKEKDEALPEIFHVISCAYRPKEKGGFLIPVLPGRVYTTAERLHFLGRDGKNFVLEWLDIVSIKKEKGFMKSGDNAICITYRNANDEASFVLSRFGSRDSVMKHLQLLLESSKNPLKQENDLPRAAPDELLERMTIVLSKTLKNVSVQEVYNKVWSEGNGTPENPFYGPWLHAEDCFEINVEDWEFAEKGATFTGPWCKETYTQKRLATFKFKRTTHLYIGPPVAFVKQMHYCRVEGGDKCVVAISATFEGIPYSDCFSVEMRWVARRLGRDLGIKVGLEVDFKKSTLLKSQIKSGTIAETKHVHQRMFDAVKRICSSSDDSDGMEKRAAASDESIIEESTPSTWYGALCSFRSSLSMVPISNNFVMFTIATFAYPVLLNFFSSLFGAPTLTVSEANSLKMEVKELKEEVRTMRSSLDMMVVFLEQRK